MAHAHESNTKRIWIVFGILSVITIVEVLFGISKSLLSLVAIIPSRKKSRAGLVKLSKSKSKFMFFYFLAARVNLSFIDFPKP